MSTDLSRYALDLAAASGAVEGHVKKHKFHGHPLDREALRAALQQAALAITEMELELMRGPPRGIDFNAT